MWVLKAMRVWCTVSAVNAPWRVTVSAEAEEWIKSSADFDRHAHNCAYLVITVLASLGENSLLMESPPSPPIAEVGPRFSGLEPRVLHYEYTLDIRVGEEAEQMSPGEEPRALRMECVLDFSSRTACVRRLSATGAPSRKIEQINYHFALRSEPLPVEPKKKAPTFARRLLNVAVAPLPLSERARYAEEFAGELMDLAEGGASRRRQWGYTVALVLDGIALALILRRHDGIGRRNW
ncbi:hypothetical protein QF037_009995 [Streptomyces canus]|uniref:hypothetical protein n=1 Tax=Streptomyces canus TaxID=58343 RepID=UPI002789FF8E|nr:hypothetical protein [Streptomyces canus]MDQ0605562.1 hypothetical protein [Streptomyces canus]